jgi:hypothetical protein
MKKVLFVALLSAVTVLGVSAQKFKPAPTFLSGEKEINIIFDYSKVEFDGDTQEEQYEDKGQEWVEEWEGKRRNNNAKAFLESFNGELEEIGMIAGDYPEAQYTIVVNVIDCDFGAYAGPFSVEAKLESTLQVVKTGTTETLSSITLKESQNPYSVVGTPIDFDRIYLAFVEVGEEAGEKFVKVVK